MLVPGRKERWAVLAAAACLAVAPAARAADQIALPANDLLPLLGLAGFATTPTVKVQSNPEPPLTASPRADCGPGSHPLGGIQGRVPAWAIRSPEAARGWTCNTELVGRRESTGGFRTWRYIDKAGHECAYYDEALIHPSVAISIPGLPGTGVAVLDMSDPSRPVESQLLKALPMQGPHESLNLNERRGLLAAELGTGGTAPGLLAVYDVSRDCRHPTHKSTTLAASFGHESGWSPDGRTFWMAGGIGLAAIDMSNPADPRKLWEGAEYVHGLTVSGDGNRLYAADPINGQLTILDSTEVQARKPRPQVREVSRLTWKSVSIPQNTAPMTIDGHPYLLEFDEFAFRFTGVPQTLHQVGGARIIDIADERHPRVVSNIRLQVNQLDTHLATAGDPGTLPPVQGYAAHYCAIPREVDPQIVACSFINSGLRVFDIRDPLHPREVAYYVAPAKAGLTNLAQRSNLALSQPAFAPERREVWYTDGVSGFYALKLDKRAWPDPVKAARCIRRRSVVIRFRGKPRLRAIRVSVNGKRVKARRARGGVVRVSLPPRLRGRTFLVRVRARSRSGRRVSAKRRFRVCLRARARTTRRGPTTGPVVPPPGGSTASWDEAEARQISWICRLGDPR
jgi:hypothetical protein